MYKKQGHNNERKERHLHNNLLKPIEAPPISFTFGKRKLVLAGWARWLRYSSPTPAGSGQQGTSGGGRPACGEKATNGRGPGDSVRRLREGKPGWRHLPPRARPLPPARVALIGALVT